MPRHRVIMILRDRKPWIMGLKGRRWGIGGRLRRFVCTLFLFFFLSVSCRACNAILPIVLYSDQFTFLNVIVPLLSCVDIAVFDSFISSRANFSFSFTLTHFILKPIYQPPKNTQQTLSSYDADSTTTIHYLQTHPSCTGRIGATGMCLGGHLAYRAALSPNISATTCFFATDLHSKTLGAGKNDDSLERAGEIRGEMVIIFGKADGHVSAVGRDFIWTVTGEKGARFSWVELEGAQRECCISFFYCSLSLSPCLSVCMFARKFRKWRG